jgi:exodeoxyribonuclease V alpha subunit
MELCGTLSGIQVFGAWARAALLDSEGATVRVVGAVLGGLTEEREYRLSGQWRQHAKFGWQFEAEKAWLTVTVDKAFLEAELQRLFGGCGTKTAKQLVSDFESQSGHEGWMTKMLDGIDRRPWEFETPTGKLRYIGPLNLPPAIRFFRSLQARVGRQLSESVITKVHELLVGDTSPEGRGRELELLAQLAVDPYSPMLAIESYNFETADFVASGLDLPRMSPVRLAYLAYECVRSTCMRSGHSYLTTAQFKSALTSLDHSAPAQACLTEALNKGLPIESDALGLYLTAALQAECTVATAFAQMCGPSEPLWTSDATSLTAGLASAEHSMGVTLDASQRQAVLALMTSRRRLHTLTAGPGCGKTTVMEALAALLGEQANFAAPTGKAAKVLARRVGKFGTVATTVHSLLGSNGDTFALDAATPLQGTLIVVDEAGMQDLAICAALVQAMPPHMHLLLVGDMDQLDSVGPGCVLADVVRLEQADHHRLSTPHRSGQSILTFLQGLREGKVLEAPQDGSVVLHQPDPDPAKCFAALSDEWLSAVARTGLESVALLFGHRRGDPAKAGLNVTFANAALQDLINPADSSNTVPGSSLRVEDRILIRKNLSLRHRGEDGRLETYCQLVNGDSGYLAGFAAGEGGLESLRLRMDDGRIVDLPAMLMTRVELGYAQTVHSAQGSEFLSVILFLSGRGGDFMSRRLLYTGASRARERLTLVARPADLASIAAHQSAQRQSGVVQRTRSLLLGETTPAAAVASSVPLIAPPVRAQAAQEPTRAPAPVAPPLTANLHTPWAASSPTRSVF